MMENDEPTAAPAWQYIIITQHGMYPTVHSTQGVPNTNGLNPASLLAGHPPVGRGYASPHYSIKARCAPKVGGSLSGMSLIALQWHP